MRARSAIWVVVVPWLVAGCGEDPGDGLGDYYEGVLYDAENPYGTVSADNADGLYDVYEAPTDLPELISPEIIVSLDLLTLHLFDRRTGFSEVFPVGAGVLNRDGVSITPTGHFESGPDTADGWWYIARRTVPAAFGGFPFLRLTILNSDGYATYGIHGPITETLVRGYVSHGCVRMEGLDAVRVFYLVRHHASTPVTIQREPELDAAGHVVDLDSEVTLWAPGDPIEYGESVGDAPPRDDTGVTGGGCADDRFESDDPVAVEAGEHRGLVLCAGDTDVYAVELQEGETLTVVVSFPHTVADLDLRVTNPDGKVVAGSYSVSDQESVTFTAGSDGTYLVEVYMYGQGEDTGYSLTIG